MKCKKLKGLDGSLDTAWSLLVKLRAGNKCEYCMKTRTIQSHHVYTRSKRSTRWDVRNGCCLCAFHHTLSSSFSAHKSPYEFFQWIIGVRGQNWFDSLRLRSNTISKLHDFEKKILLKELQDEIKTYE